MAGSTVAYYKYMQKEFTITIKRKPSRQRFYSSMDYQEYCDLFGPPSPLFKPQDDPPEELPLLELETPLSAHDTQQEHPLTMPMPPKMDTIFQIEASQHFQGSPQNDWSVSNLKYGQIGGSGAERIDGTGGVGASGGGEGIGGVGEKRVRVRMRSQSDNCEYLIFNFLSRDHQKGRKKVKLE